MEKFGLLELFCQTQMEHHRDERLEDDSDLLVEGPPELVHIYLVSSLPECMSTAALTLKGSIPLVVRLY